MHSYACVKRVHTGQAKHLSFSVGCMNKKDHEANNLQGLWIGRYDQIGRI